METGLIARQQMRVTTSFIISLRNLAGSKSFRARSARDEALTTGYRWKLKPVSAFVFGRSSGSDKLPATGGGRLCSPQYRDKEVAPFGALVMQLISHADQGKPDRALLVL
jgi:hypothetical protein